MQDNSGWFTQDFYTKNLNIINNVCFTRREIDIISCLMNARRTNQIASILSISPRTVTTHFRNIMLRLDCNSQEGIINFIEKSNNINSLRRYYSDLLINSKFEKRLKEISKLKHELGPSCLVIYWKALNLRNFFLHSLKNHLLQAGIISEVKEQSLDQQMEHIENSSYTHLILLENKDHQNIPQELLEFDFTDFSEQHCYYFSVFEILKKLRPNNDIEKIYTQFRKEYNFLNNPYLKEPAESIIEEHEENHTALFRKLPIASQWLFMFIGVVLIAFCGVGIIFFNNNEISTNKYGNNFFPMQETKGFSIRSDLVIPTKSVYLHRPELIAQMEDKLKNQNGIQTVALIGIGGAGKTTLARQYAHQQKESVIWEINAETHESLTSSFENLAQALAKTDSNQKDLKVLQEIKKPEEKEKRILEFVKNCLRWHKNWLLIFDNVEKFSNIQKFFPVDVDTWGKGKVILTTRNSNIRNNKHVNGSVYIEELEAPQKWELFTNIMFQEKHFIFSPTQKNETIKFLEKLPSFPLDISVAAYYLKATNTSYAAYLESINQFSKDFADIQENLLKESGDYKKTRYGIITLSLQRLVNTNKDFADLLLFTSLLDSQNIPRDILDGYKKHSIVDNFIYNLKKFSLITDAFTSSSLGSNFSIHRNTQKIILSYLTKNIFLEKNNQLLERISKALGNYMVASKDREDYEKMRLLIRHCEAFLSYGDLLTLEIKSDILTELGCIYCYLGDFIKAKLSLEESLDILNKYQVKNHNKIAWSLANLGHIYTELGNFGQARDLLEQSLGIYKKYASEDYQRIAWTLKHLGNVYRESGNYGQAKDLLEQSLEIHKKYMPNHHIDIIWNLLFLGYTYRDTGEYEKAKELFEQVLVICKKYLLKDHIDVAWTLGNLGEVYRVLGNYKKAEDLLQQSLIICKKNLYDNHVHISWILRRLGDLYIDLGEYEKAKELLERALIICRKHLPENHLRIAITLTSLGNVYKAQKNYERAKVIFEKAFLISEEHLSDDHIDIALVVENLGIVYGELKNYEKAQKLLQQSIRIYEKHYGKSHVESAKALKNFAHIYILMNQLEAAEKFLNKSQEIFQQNNHPDIYIVLETLGELYLKKSMHIENKGILQKSQNFKIKSISYLKQALEIVKMNFSENSPHIVRIHMKLEKIKR